MRRLSDVFYAVVGLALIASIPVMAAIYGTAPHTDPPILPVAPGKPTSKPRLTAPVRIADIQRVTCYNDSLFLQFGGRRAALYMDARGQLTLRLPDGSRLPVLLYPAGVAP
jgi:hypothetical protein